MARNIIITCNEFDIYGADNKIPNGSSYTWFRIDLAGSFAEILDL